MKATGVPVKYKKNALLFKYYLLGHSKPDWKKTWLEMRFFRPHVAIWQQCLYSMFLKSDLYIACILTL